MTGNDLAESGEDNGSASGVMLFDMPPTLNLSL